MIAIFIVLIAGAVLAVSGTAAFVLIVISIQMVDRSKQLMHEPRSLLDAATRRLLGATRRSSRLHQTKES